MNCSNSIKGVQIALLIWLLLINIAIADTSPIDSLIIQCRSDLYNAINNFSEQQLLESRSMFERILSMDSKKAWITHYYIGLANENLVFYYQHDKEKQAQCIENGIEHLLQSVKLNKKFADAYALLSSLYGIKIGVDKFKAIDLSAKSSNAIEKAMKYEPDNPRVYIVAGRSAFYTPEAFGGGLKKAKSNFKTAMNLFSVHKSPQPIYPDWGYAETYCWLGQAAVKEDSIDLAEQYYKTALDINPDYGLIKYKLLPMLENKKTVNTPFIIPNGGSFLMGDTIAVRITCVNNNNQRIYYTLDGEEPDRESQIYSIPIRINRSAMLKAKVIKESRQSNTVTAEFYAAEPRPSEEELSDLTNGLTFQYFQGSWHELPNFDSLNTIKAGVAADFDFTKFIDDENNFALQFHGYIDIKKRGTYYFYMRSDDGSQLHIGDQLMINNDGLHGDKTEKSRIIALDTGAHPIAVAYFQREGAHTLELSYEGPGIPKQKIPSHILYHQQN